MTKMDSFDWDEFWRTASEKARKTARPGRFDKPDQFERFFARRGVPETVCSVGCGPADFEVELAQSYPGAAVDCYDTSETIVEENRKRATEADIENIAFGVATLPDSEISGQYDLVYCYATLTYVRAIERALRNLYALVAPGGYLVFDYPNQHTRASYRDHLADGVPDPDRFRERFGLVLDGENLLSHERIHEVLGRWPQSFYAAVDREDPPRDSPCVFVPK